MENGKRYVEDTCASDKVVDEKNFSKKLEFSRARISILLDEIYRSNELARFEALENLVEKYRTFLLSIEEDCVEEKLRNFLDLNK